MSGKISIKGQMCYTGVVMLLLSALAGGVVTLLVFGIYVAQIPERTSFITGAREFMMEYSLGGPEELIPWVFLEGFLLCSAVALVCFLVISRNTSKVANTIRSLRIAADRMGEGDLDFEILSCDQRELDELCRSLEQVRLRLKKAEREERAAQRRRGLLMANISHDLRSPITSIKGYVEGLRDGVANTPEKQQRYLDVVWNKTLTMEKVVRNMTDFSEYELGRMQYRFELVALVPFLQDIGEEYAEDVERAGLSWNMILPNEPMTVMADRNKLKRALDNLMSNAIKYSRKNGEILFEAEIYESGVVLQITDDGQGIGQEALRHVFESFYREDFARSSDVPGSGLGLSICRSITEAHHGKIWLTSDQGKGTHACVYLPLRKSEQTGA